MKISEKIKSLAPKLNSRKGKIIGLAMLITGSVAAVTVTTLAWFNLAAKESTIEMVSGDLNVQIEKVSAYKYVYPYFKGSTEFINYGQDNGTFKKYVLEDHNLLIDDEPVDEKRDITSDNAIVTLGAKTPGNYVPVFPDDDDDINDLSATNVHYEDIDIFRYYLIGDGLFCGVEDKPWSIESAFAFANITGSPTEANPIVLDDVVVSAGSHFTFFDTNGAGYDENEGEYICNYYSLSSNSVSPEKSPFRVVDNSVYCIRSGIYKFSYYIDSSGETPQEKLKIELHTGDNGTRKDISVITNNSLDATMISIEHAGGRGGNKTLPQYMPEAIESQNTMVVLDVELKLTNAHPVDLNLRINRLGSTNNSIHRLPNRYNDTTSNLIGYVNESEKNLLRASDFYNYYAVFTKANSAYANASAIWAAMHVEGNANFQKFQNGETYDPYIDCVLHPKENDDETLIPGSTSDQFYHCYISIEYDYEHCLFFLNKDRLGKTYLLDRDFGFRFSGTQHEESQQ